MPPEFERTLRLTVTSSYFACFAVRSVRGLLRCGVVAVTVVALQDLVCLRFGVTVMLPVLDLARAADRRRGGVRSVVAAVAAYRSDCDRMISAQLAYRRHRNAQNLSEAHN